MIKCLECGFEAERLQWTHFKYKCTGKFSNGREYMSAYPGAIVVDPELANKTKVTLENLISKYGEIEGKNRWDSYRQKQAISNSFEYKQQKYGWSKDQFDEYNSSRSQTLEKMITRYGEINGAIKWEQYCERQAFTNTLQYFIEKYGEHLGSIKYKEVNLGKSSYVNPKLLAEKMNISVEDAIDVILSRNKCSGSTWGSLLEKEFTNLLEINLGEKLEYSTFSKPFGKWAPLLNSYVIFDIKHKNCVIEFNGDYWHANPNLYKKDAIIRGRTVHEINERDELKKQTAINLGFRYMVVWESEYKQNKQQMINEVIKWMRNGLR